MKRISLPEIPETNQINAAYVIISNATGMTARRSKQLAAQVYEAFVQTAPPPDCGGLTAQQAKMMRLLQDFIDENEGRSPTRQELCRAYGTKHKSTVQRCLERLQDRGFIEIGSGWREVIIRRRIH